MVFLATLTVDLLIVTVLVALLLFLAKAVGFAAKIISKRHNARGMYCVLIISRFNHLGTPIYAKITFHLIFLHLIDIFIKNATLA